MTDLSWDDPDPPDNSDFPTSLTEEENSELGNFHARMAIVRDRVRGLVGGYGYGLYLWGDGGISKSWTVQDELNRLGANFRLTNTRLTGKGFFLLLAEYPDSIHVIEDAESLLSGNSDSAKAAAGIFRSAFWTNDPKGERKINWTTANEQSEILFTGSVILIMNADLESVPALKAMKTRIAVLHLQPTDLEVAALAKSIALKGYKHANGFLHAKQCLEVYEYVYEVCRRVGRNYDLRMMINGFIDRLQWERGHADTHWKGLVESRLRERATPKEKMNRADRLQDDRQIAREIDDLKITFMEKIRLWTERTGRGKTAFYERLSDVAEEDPPDRRERAHKRQEFDYYATPAWAVASMLDCVKLNGPILEPCSGDGAISRVVESRGYSVKSSDIRNDDGVYGDRGINVLDILEWDGDIVTNPPYRIAEEVIGHCLSIVPKGRRVVMLLRMGFYEAACRSDFFARNPPEMVLSHTRRVKFRSADSAQLNKDHSAWYVWTVGWEGKTVLDRLG
jgi:hypothetical protein